MAEIGMLKEWESYLVELENFDFKTSDYKVITKLTKLCEHLPPQPTPRFVESFENCTQKTSKILTELVDKIELSNKKTLKQLLKLFKSFGYFRISQITYFIGSTNEETEPLYRPRINSSKWYSLQPLLPEAGTIGWKSLLAHCLVREESDLFSCSVQLLLQKLHFGSILNSLEAFRFERPIIKKMCSKVAEKIIVICKDTAYEDGAVLKLDSFVISLLLENSKDHQVIVEIVLEELFKPTLSGGYFETRDISHLTKIIQDCFMDQPGLQENVLSGLTSHLKLNLIRRKRRRSTVEDIPSDHRNFEDTLMEYLKNVTFNSTSFEPDTPMPELEVKQKDIQLSYLDYWLDLVILSLESSVLTAKSSEIVLTTSLSLFFSVLSYVTDTTANKMIRVIIAAIENTRPEFLDAFFELIQSNIILFITKKIADTEELKKFSPQSVQNLYKTIFRSSLSSILAGHQKTVEQISSFINFVHGKSIKKDLATIIGSVIILEFGSCMQQDRFSRRSDICEFFNTCIKKCNKRVKRFIRKHTAFKTNLFETTIHDDSMIMDITSESNEGDDIEESKLAMHVLVNIINLSVRQNDAEMLDEYSDYIVDVLNYLDHRLRTIITELVILGKVTVNSIDPYLSRLLNIYIQSKPKIVPFFPKDLISSLIDIFATFRTDQVDITEGKKLRKVSKLIVSSMKQTLQSFDDDQKCDDYSANIINRQYLSIVEPIIVTTSESTKEKFCMTSLEFEKNLDNLLALLFSNCKDEDYVKVCETIVNELEICDATDHNKVIYITSILAALASELGNTANSGYKYYESRLNSISCNLVRIIKSLDLGPSIHAYKNVGSHKSTSTIQCCTSIACMNLYTHLCTIFSGNQHSSVLTDAIYMLTSSNLQKCSSNLDLRWSFVRLSHASINLLKSTCLGKRKDNSLVASLSVFLTALSTISNTLISASDIRKLEMLCDTESFIDLKLTNDNVVERRMYEKYLKLIAIEVARLLNHVSTLRVKLIEFAPYVIADYVQNIQQAPCLDTVRQSLDEGIYRIFNLVDAHQNERKVEIKQNGVQRQTQAAKTGTSLFSMIHARLDQASREILQDMYDNYKKFYKYKSKV